MEDIVQAIRKDENVLHKQVKANIIKIYQYKATRVEQAKQPESMDETDDQSSIESSSVSESKVSTSVTPNKNKTVAKPTRKDFNETVTVEGHEVVTSGNERESNRFIEGLIALLNSKDKLIMEVNLENVKLKKQLLETNKILSDYQKSQLHLEASIPKHVIKPVAKSVS